MRNAYAILGLAFLIVFGAAYILLDHAYAPITEKSLLDSNESTTMALQLSSPTFENNEAIPIAYTCDGEGAIPPFVIEGVPADAVALVLVMDDSDIPQAIKEAKDIEKFDHLVLYNIPVDTTTIEAGEVPGTFGLNSAGAAAYTGPCPPTEYEPTEHRYHFRLYAVREQLEFDGVPTLDDVEAAATDRMIEQAALFGTYARVQ